MEQKTDRLYPSLEIKNIDLEQQLETKINDLNSFNNAINNNKEMITHFKDKNNKSTKKYIKYKTFTSILKSFDTFVFVTTTFSSVILSLTGIGLIVISISAGVACGLTISNNVIYEIVIEKYNKYEKQNEKYQQTVKSFDKLYHKTLQGYVNDKSENESLCKKFTNCLDETKKESFL